MSAAMELTTTDRKQTLDDIVSTITELCEMRDVAQTPDEFEAAEKELERVVRAELAAKVDAVAFFDRKCDAEIALRKDLAKSAAIAGAQWERRKEHIRTLVKSALSRLQTPKLKGNVFQAYLSNGRSSLHVTDPALVPAQFKTASIEMPLDAWRLICSFPGFQGMFDAAEVTVNTVALREALKQGPVPGACMETGDQVLNIR